ncbi:MAG TPA: hypothetical protein VED59_06200 [Acidimicrobiales bacterium]|nr:hypothetical protein [Acidimicrobiales bacterium]
MESSASAGNLPERETTMNSLDFQLGKERQQDLIRQAERYRLVAEARRARKAAALEARGEPHAQAGSRLARTPGFARPRLGRKTV